MGTFNQFSQIEPFVRTKLNSRIGNPMGVSKLNTWIRLFSSRYETAPAPLRTAGEDSKLGLILVSNPDYKLFKATGDASVSTIYGGGTQSGVIGVHWNGEAVYDSGGVGLRPSPVVTSIEVDEGMSQTLSRKATVTIKAFTEEQMNIITQYFLEPGFTVFLEWGWNTNDAAQSIIPIKGGSDKILQYIRDTNNFQKLSERRKNSKGDYDSYLGYIIGGSMSASDGGWEITVELAGLPEIPFYLRVQRSKTATDKDAAEKKDSRNLFKPSEIDEAKSNIGKANFMRMYNDLPESLQIPEIRSLERDVLTTANSTYLNFDTTVREQLNNATSGKEVKSDNFTQTKAKKTKGFSTNFSGIDLTQDVGTIKFPTQDNISSDRYIRIEALFKIIETVLKTFSQQSTLNSQSIQNFNPFNPLNSANDNVNKRIGQDTVLRNSTENNIINLDISQTVISAFPEIFSLDGKILFIPNKKTPKFTVGSFIGNNAVETITDLGVMDNSVDGFEFPINRPLKKLSGGGVGVAGEGSEVKGAGEWGRLADLYINFDFAKTVLSTNNFTAGDVVKNLLNGISKAANNYWNFQIIEDVDNNTKNLKLQIIDEGFTPNYDDVTNPTEYVFTNVGEKSIFTDRTFSLDIGGAMTNRIIGQRLSNNANSNQSHTGLFSKNSADKILDITNTTTGTNSTNNAQSSTDTKENIDEQLQLYLNKVNIIPKPNVNIKTGFFTGEITNKIEDVALFTSYNDTELFESFHLLDERVKENSSNKVSPLLPIKFSFTTHGISGIKRFDTFRVRGIPKQYETGGFFQVTSIKHSIQDMKWMTTVEGQFRNTLKRG